MLVSFVLVSMSNTWWMAAIFYIVNFILLLIETTYTSPISYANDCILITNWRDDGF